MYLIFDVSPIAKAINYKASFTDVNAWPRLAHISWIVLGEDLKPIEDFDSVVVDDRINYDGDLKKNLHLDDDDIKRKGAPLEEILKTFNTSCSKVQYVFSHNLNYNQNILAAEYLRQMISLELFKVDRYCLMQEGTHYAKLPARGGGYKWPSLPELHAACFKTAYAPVNNARADVIAATRCFIKLMKTGTLEDIFED
ncbi:MAG: hypothetical protein R2774_11570 [Saprospiraceae bacterium]